MRCDATTNDAKSSFFNAKRENTFETCRQCPPHCTAAKQSNKSKEREMCILLLLAVPFRTKYGFLLAHSKRNQKLFSFFFSFPHFWMKRSGWAHTRTHTHSIEHCFFYYSFFSCQKCQTLISNFFWTAICAFAKSFSFFFIHSTISYNYLVGCCTWSSS